MKRREFLKVAAVAATAAATVAPIAAHGDEFPLKGKIKKAVGYGMVKEFSTPEDKFKLLKDLGFDGVETGINEVDPAALRKASEATGIVAHGVVHGWSLDKIPESIDYAKAIGADSVLVVPDKVGDGVYYDELYTRSQAVYREVVAHAEKQQVMLLLENVWNNFLISPLESARYVDEMNHPWFAFYFDAGNVIRYGWSEQWIRVLGKRIRKLHLKDYSREKQEKEGLWKGFDVEIGEGSANWKEIRRELAAIGYEGWATAEVGGGDRKRLKQVGDEMDKVLNLA